MLPVGVDRAVLVAAALSVACSDGDGTLPPKRGSTVRAGCSGAHTLVCPAQAGVSKERIFESTLVILTPKRPKSNKKSASASQKVKKPKPRVESTPAEVEAREQNRQEAKSLGLCVACGAPPSRTRPGARYVPSSTGNTGNTAGKPGRKPGSRGNRPSARPRSSDDNPGHGSLEPLHVQG